MYLLRMLKAVVEWGWSPTLITALAVVGVFYEWPVTLVAVLAGVILVVGLVVAVVRARERELERSAMRFRQLAGYFNRRFTGNSPLSIFAIIDTLFAIDNPQLWDWARACDMSKRVFDTWCNSFVDRIESDTRTGRFSIYLRTFLNEFWLMTGHYSEFIGQFFELGVKVEIPLETVDQYNRFVVEYNTFVQNFQDSISELKKISRTEIEAPSVSFASALSLAKPPQPSPAAEKKPKSGQSRGYYL